MDRMTDGVTCRLNMELVSKKVQPTFCRVVACVAGGIGPRSFTAHFAYGLRRQERRKYHGHKNPSSYAGYSVARIKKPTLSSLLCRISRWVFQ